LPAPPRDAAGLAQGSMLLHGGMRTRRVQIRRFAQEKMRKIQQAKKTRLLSRQDPFSLGKKKCSTKKK